VRVGPLAYLGIAGGRFFASGVGTITGQINIIETGLEGAFNDGIFLRSEKAPTVP
jgi:hypothetical protein